jgi:hypothetical protein
MFLEPFILELGALYSGDLQFPTCCWPRRNLTGIDCIQGSCKFKTILHDAAASAETQPSLEHPAFKMSGWRYNSTHSQRSMYVVSFILQQFYPRRTILISIGLCAGGPWRLSTRGGGMCLLPLPRDSFILSQHTLVTKLAKLSPIP